MNSSVKDFDSYFSLQPKSVRSSLEKLRQAIKTLAPDTVEVISYGMPAYKYHGMLVGFAAYKKHIGFYPWNGSTVPKFKDELKQFNTSKGAIQFPIDKPIPLALVKKIVKFRMKENLNKVTIKPKSK